MKYVNIKRVLALTLAATMVFSVMGCGKKKEEAAEEPVEEAEEQEVGLANPWTETTEKDAMFDETKVFGYNAPDAESTDAEDATDENADATADQATGTVDQAAIDEAIYAYILDELGKGYEASDVSIPYYEIIDINSDDPEDIRVYGDFWYFTYKINGDTLETQAGGSYPGCIHLKSTTSGVAVTSMDVVEDGSNFDSSAKEIFGDLYNAFIDLHANDEARDQTRTDMIAAYVKKNGLMVTKYQDYGWDPVVFR